MFFTTRQQLITFGL